MTEPHVVHCYQYVTHPYDEVLAALRTDALGVFQRATVTAASRATALVASLRVKLGGVEVGTDAIIRVTDIIDDGAALGAGPRTRLRLEWHAAHAAELFPSMKAELSIYPLSKDETQLDFVGRYTPPLGFVGGALDAIAGHRIAEASVHRFVEDVATRLRAEIPRKRAAEKHAAEPAEE